MSSAPAACAASRQSSSRLRHSVVASLHRQESSGCVLYPANSTPAPASAARVRSEPLRSSPFPGWQQSGTCGSPRQRRRDSAFRDSSRPAMPLLRSFRASASESGASMEYLLGNDIMLLGNGPAKKACVIALSSQQSARRWRRDRFLLRLSNRLVWCTGRVLRDAVHQKRQATPCQATGRDAPVA
jgi:hypothetical protein